MTRHEVLENLSVALDTLRARKVRSGLTILGIVIGVTTVIAVASIIDGLNGEIKERVERLGSNTLFITRIPPMQNTARLPPRFASANTCRMTMRTSSRRPAPPYRTPRCSPIASTSTIRRTKSATATRTWSVSSCAACSRSTSMRFPLFAVAAGPLHFGFRRRACAQRGGDRTRHRRFALSRTSTRSAKSVRLDGRLYEVIGVFEPDQGLFSSFGVDQFACIPMSNFRKSFPGDQERFIAVAGKDRFSLDYREGIRWKKRCGANGTCRTTRKTISRSHRPTS